MDDPLLPPPPGAEFDLPLPDDSEPAPVRPSVASNPFLSRAQKFGVKGSETPRKAEPEYEPEDASASFAKMSVAKPSPAAKSNPYKSTKAGAVTNPYQRGVISSSSTDEPEVASSSIYNPYKPADPRQSTADYSRQSTADYSRQSTARKPTEAKASYGYGGGGGDDDLPPPPGGDDDDGGIPEPTYQPKASVASPYQAKQSVASSSPYQAKQSVASPYSQKSTPSYSAPVDDDPPPAEDDDPEEAERKKRIIEKIKKQQQQYQAGIIAGGDPKAVSQSMSPPQKAQGGRGGGGGGVTPEDLPYIADDGKGPWCAFCGGTLRGQQIMEVGGKEYHPRCFVCAQCRKPLTGQMLTVQDRYYHPGCLQCKHCQQSLNGKQFVVNPANKQVYCPEHARLDKGGSGLKCAGCKDPISGKEPVINALNAQWHQMCFVCDNCRETLVGQACVANKGKPYCEGCYEQLFRTKCSACNQVIDGQVLELGSEGTPVSYHPSCFKCGTCDKPLKGAPFYLKGAGVYCEAHAL